MANDPNSSVRDVDGQYSFENGVFGDRIRTIASPQLPNGIPRTGLSWLVNGTVRGGGVTQRTGWNPVVQNAPWPVATFQGAFMLERDFANPYIVLAIGGDLWRVRVDTDNSVDNLSATFGLSMPPTVPHAYFAEAAGLFLVWQAGDLITNPIFFWDDGATLIGMRRSNGFIGVNNAANQIPPATSMDFSNQRLWYTIVQRYIAGDINQSRVSGTAPFDYRDATLAVTENPVASAGDAFSVPTSAGNIRALAHTSNLDDALGESPLFIFTRKAVYACTAPITRNDWTKATLDLMPLQRVILKAGGTYADRSVVAVNGDLFFNSNPNGDIRSLTMAVRNFTQWGQVPISRQENRIIQFNDRALLRECSGCQFDNRLLEATRPETTPVGVACSSILPLDFDIIATLQERQPPAWEGHQQGILVLQLLAGDFGGRERAFAVVWSQVHAAIEIWELTSDSRFDNANRIETTIEFPAYTWGNQNQLWELDAVEFEMSKMLGTVEFRIEYRPDHFPCWLPWRSWKVCTAANCTELIDDPCANTGYPVEVFCESFRSTMLVPKPPPVCIKASARPSNIAFQHQVKLTFKGYCEINSIRAYALPRPRAPYAGIVCG